MASLEWNAALILDFPVMDEVHEEFVTLLAQVEAAGDEQLCALWDELIAHTQQHFDQEDRWMQTTGFATGNCHSQQHKVVLAVLREKIAANGISNMQPVFIEETGTHFSPHSFDLIYSLMTLHHIPDTGEVQLLLKRNQRIAGRIRRFMDRKLKAHRRNFLTHCVNPLPVHIRCAG